MNCPASPKPASHEMLGLGRSRGRLTIHFAPADLRKEGPAYDLPTAVELLAVAEHLLPD
jgi:magnesium chelatase family protein